MTLPPLAAGNAEVALVADGFESISVGIAHERREIARAVLGTESARTAS
jgi:hypothetical protein